MTREQIARGLRQVEVLALTLYHEAGDQGRKGMELVAAVLARRLRLGFRGTSWAEVCIARKQFSCWNPDPNDPNHQRLVAHANLIRVGQPPRVMDLAFEIAGLAIRGALPDDIAAGADHYCTRKALDAGEVSWAEGETPVLEHGSHVFFRLRPDERTV